MKRENNIEINDALIVRYLVGEAYPEEAMALDDWLIDPGNRLHFENLRATWHAVYPRKTRRDVMRADAWSKITKAIDKQPAAEPRRDFRLVYRMAASLALLIVAGAGIYYLLHESVSEIQVATSTSVKHIKFSDQSAAILHQNTDLRYRKDFGGHQREVRLLKGEAFFNVTPDGTRPFIIHTQAVDIRVVGTSFNVTVKNDETEVGVYEGKVMLITGKDTVYLEAGAAAAVHTGSRSIFTQAPANANDWGYATRRFIFKDTPLKDVIESFQKAFPYAIRLKDPTINNCKLTATFDKVSAEKMLDLIAETLNLSVTRNDTVFTLEGPGCP